SCIGREPRGPAKPQADAYQGCRTATPMQTGILSLGARSRQKSQSSCSIRPAFTGWAEALPPSPTLAGAARAGSEAPATKVVGNVSLASPLGSGGGNALGYAWCCGRHNRTMSRLGRLWSKAECSNRASSNSNQNFSHGGFSLTTVACPL